mgnify:CR=1 FL=1
MIALKGARGAECRKTILDTLNLYMDISSDKGTVTLRGESTVVREGLEELRNFLLNNVSEDVTLSQDECIALSQSGTGEADSLRKQIETKFNVEIYLSSKMSLMKVRGTQDAVDAAKQACQGDKACTVGQGKGRLGGGWVDQGEDGQTGARGLRGGAGG